MADWTRRSFQKTLALGAVGALACRSADPDDSDDPSGRGPSGVLLITADDLGWRDLSSYGLTAIETPAIDRLVAEGVAFDRAFDVVSTCSSSRASLATGQYPHTHGVTGLTHRNPELSLPLGTPVLASVLREQGRRTAIQGKWHLSAEAQPDAFGYAQYLPTDIDQRIRDVDAAISFIEGLDDAPFFLELNFMQTHRDIFERFEQVEGFEVPVDDATPPVWWGLPDWPEIREEVAGYLSQLRYMDALVGQVLDTLDQTGRTDDTLVVFLSDNGPAFPGCKLTLYDRGVGTPLVFRWPAALAPRWENGLVSSVQIAPTILDLLGVPGLPDAQGRSLAPLLRGEDSPPATALFSEMESHVGPKPARAVRTERWKYIVNLTDEPWGRGDGEGAWMDALALEPDQHWDEPRVPEELYDLDADPLERDNRIDDPQLADVLNELRTLLADHAARTLDPRASELPEPSEPSE